MKDDQLDSEGADGEEYWMQHSLFPGKELADTDVDRSVSGALEPDVHAGISEFLSHLKERDIKVYNTLVSFSPTLAKIGPAPDTEKGVVKSIDDVRFIVEDAMKEFYGPAPHSSPDIVKLLNTFSRESMTYAQW